MFRIVQALSLVFFVSCGPNEGDQKVDFDLTAANEIGLECDWPGNSRGFNFSFMEQIKYRNEVQGQKGRQFVMKYTFDLFDPRNRYTIFDGELIGIPSFKKIWTESPQFKANAPSLKAIARSVFDQVSSHVPICFVEIEGGFEEHADFHFFASTTTGPAGWGASYGVEVNTNYGIGSARHILAHEMLHVMGLGHSTVEPSVMATTLGAVLQQDDINALQELYGRGSCQNPASEDRMRVELTEVQGTEAQIAWSPLYFMDGHRINNYAESYQIDLAEGEGDFKKHAVAPISGELSYTLKDLKKDTSYRVRISATIDNVVFERNKFPSFRNIQDTFSNLVIPLQSDPQQYTWPGAYFTYPDSVDPQNYKTNNWSGVKIAWVPKPGLSLRVRRQFFGGDLVPLAILDSNQSVFLDAGPFDSAKGIPRYSLQIIGAKFSATSQILNFKTLLADPPKREYENSLTRKKIGRKYSQLKLWLDSNGAAVENTNGKSKIKVWELNSPESTTIFETKENILDFQFLDDSGLLHLLVTSTNGKRCQFSFLKKGITNSDPWAVVTTHQRPANCGIPKFADHRFGFQMIWNEGGENPGLFEFRLQNYLNSISLGFEPRIEVVKYSDGDFYKVDFLKNAGRLDVVASGQYMNQFGVYVMHFRSPPEGVRTEYFLSNGGGMELLAGNSQIPYMISHPFTARGESIDYYWQSHHKNSNMITRVFTKLMPGDSSYPHYKEFRAVYEVAAGEVFPLGEGNILVVDNNNIKLYDDTLGKKQEFTYEKASHGDIIQVFRNQNQIYLLMQHNGSFKLCKAFSSLICNPYLAANFKTRPLIIDQNGQTKLIGIAEDGNGNSHFVSSEAQQ